MALATPLTALLGIEHPLILAPMATVSGGALAAAVSRAGGLGLIGGGYGDPDWLAREVQAAGNARFGIGFIAWALRERPELLELALDHAPQAIFLSFGELEPFAERVKRAGTTLIAQVQTLAQTKAALDQGADLLVAQGTEAGGHAGVRATLPLVPAVVDVAGKVPVVAAGGIADGRGLAAALMLGAAGVLCGTAFYVSREALAHENAKRAALAASGDDTLQSRVFDTARGFDWPAEWKLRTLDNSFSRRWLGQDAALRNDPAELERYAAAAAAGDTEVAAVVVGEGVGLLRDSEPAGEIVRRMVAEAEDLLRNRPGQLLA